MTPEEFEKVAVWMGWRKRESITAVGCLEWWDRQGVFHGYVSRKTSLTPAECIEALERLVEKGYCYVMCSHNKDSHMLSVATPVDDEGYVEIVNGDDAPQPTIHEAIEAALIALIAAEGGKE